MKRREFTGTLIKAISSYALLESVFAIDGFSRAVKPITDHWAIRLNDLCSDLKTDRISALAWQNKVAELYGQVDLKELMEFIDFDAVIKSFKYPDLGVVAQQVKLPKLAGLPENTSYVKKIFGMKKDRAIIPHGHSNMASAHMVVKGEFHMRHFDKIRQDDSHLWIKPTIEKNAVAGDYSSISDERDNVHWFVANTDHAYTFDVIVLDLNGETYDIHNIDYENHETESDGSLRAPMMNVQDALKKYGKGHH